MAHASNPVRAQFDQYIADEIARVGVEGVVAGPIVKRFVALGASRTRVHEWVRDAKADASITPAQRQADEAAAAAKAAKAAAAAAKAERVEAARVEAARKATEVLDALPSPEALAQMALDAADIAAAVVIPAPAPGPPPPAAPPALPPPAAGAPANPAAIGIVPDNARSFLENLQSVIDTCNGVMAASRGTDGKVRNPRMALQSADGLRKCLETALKLYESVNNVAQIERFMSEVIAEIGTIAPGTALAIVERMRLVQGRWAR